MCAIMSFVNLILCHFTEMCNFEEKNCINTFVLIPAAVNYKFVLLYHNLMLILPSIWLE